jgi:heme-degrading monooxygenase HmoA
MSGDATIAATPKPPYYAVIFTSLRTPGDNGYGAAAERMVEIARTMPGFLGVESAREGQETGGLGITVCYWDSLAAIAIWKAHAEHQEAQRRGKAEWYASYRTRIAKVERDDAP